VSNDRRRAVVTGTSSGIGRAVAERLLAGGWQVTGVQRKDAGIAHPLFANMHADLAEPAAVERLAANLGMPDALVHAAGMLRVGSLGAMTADDARLMWQLHVSTPTCLADTLLPRMAHAGRGRFVMIGSRVSRGMPGRSQYAASKAAIVSLARSWAAEVVGRGVTVNVVSPAATDTAMLSDPARVTAPPKLPPMGRLIRADEVAALVAFLLSDDAAAITGQELVICGGASLPH
jgi:3-oxoacyl-[acyl-carrier protein] reductase